MAGVILGPVHKSFPPRSWGASLEEFLLQRPGLADFATPLVTAEAKAMAHNVALLASWSAARGIRLAPHGKTTMAPALWRQVLDAGAWGLTLATGWQVQVARFFGVDRILLANELIDPVTLRWLAEELRTHPRFEFYCWADSLDAVRGMDAVLGGLDLPAPVNVLVELGTPRGRTGAPSIDAALEVAGAIAAARSLRLAGVGGYEGPITHDRSVGGLDAIGRYLDDLVDLHRRLESSSGYAGLRPVVSAGGSAYFDLVAQHLAPLVESATVVLRSGAYQVHDDGFYRGISPFAHEPAKERFHAAMHGWARVLSRPEPHRAILDGGRRDFPFDEGLPTPQRIMGASEAVSAAALAGSRVTKLDDQHSFMLLGENADADTLPVGSVVRLGLSHPCTAFDKWRLMPVVDDASLPNPVVVDAVETYF